MQRNKNDVSPLSGGDSRKFGKTIGKENSSGTSIRPKTQVGARNIGSPGMSALGRNSRTIVTSQGHPTSASRSRASVEAEQRAVIVTATQTLLEVRNFR